MTITLQEAQARLPELMEQLSSGAEIVITRGGQPVARLISAVTPGRATDAASVEPPRLMPSPFPPKPERRGPRLGAMRGSIEYIAPDFDAPLDEFREYMP